MGQQEDAAPIFSHAEPVLPVRDIPETIRYWQEVLGFPTQFTWGDPPTFGAVSWHKAHVQFYPDPERVASSQWQSVWIRLQHIDSLYRLHQQNKAEIVSSLEKQPWGMFQYAIREINGHYIYFAGMMEERGQSESALPASVRVTGRRPTLAEYRELATSVGWTSSASDAKLESSLAATVYAAVAEDTTSGQVIGCALLQGDDVTFYYVKDVMVRPRWQRKRVGTALMQELARWLEEHAAENALTGLFTSEALEPFYRQFGFAAGFGMVRFIKREKPAEGEEG